VSVYAELLNAQTLMGMRPAYPVLDDGTRVAPTSHLIQFLVDNLQAGRRFFVWRGVYFPDARPFSLWAPLRGFYVLPGEDPDDEGDEQ